MRTFILLGFLIIIQIHLSAQSDFRPGYIITNSLDTLHGLVDYRGEIRNMRVCTFKESIEGPSKEFFPGEIFGYRFNSGKFYVSKEITTEALNETVFVEFLLKGISNLYYYKSSGYTAYFIGSEDAEWLELRSEEIEVEKDGNVFIRQDNRFRGILTYALADCPEIRKDIFQVGLTHKSLINIKRKYHDYQCSEEACVIYEKKLPVLSVEWKPLIGYGISAVSFTNSEIAHLDFQMSSSPLVGMAMNFMVPRWNEKLTFLIHLAFNKDYFYGSYFIADASYSVGSYCHINNSNLTSSFALKYTYPKYKFRPEVFAGFYGHSILNSDTRLYTERNFGSSVETTEENPELFKKFNRGITGGVGLEYKLFKKLRAFSNFSVLYGTNKQINLIETTFTSYRLSAGLTF